MTLQARTYARGFPRKQTRYLVLLLRLTFCRVVVVKSTRKGKQVADDEEVEVEEEDGSVIGRSQIWKHEAQVLWLLEVKEIDCDELTPAEIIAVAYSTRVEWRKSETYSDLVAEHTEEARAEATAKKEAAAERKAKAAAEKAEKAERKSKEEADNKAKAAGAVEKKAARATKASAAKKTAAKSAAKSTGSRRGRGRAAAAEEDPFE